MTNKKSFFTARNISFLAVLTALVVVLQIWGSAIPIGASGTSLSFVLVPIVLGAIMLGAWSGAFLGLVFGLVVLISGITGMNAFTSFLFNEQPFMTTLLCLLKGAAAGFVAGVVFNLLSKKNRYIAVFAAAVAAPVVNTGLFILGALLMGDTVMACLGLVGENVWYVVVVLVVGINFFVELAVNLIFAPALYTVDCVVEKRAVFRTVKKEEA